MELHGGDLGVLVPNDVPQGQGAPQGQHTDPKRPECSTMFTHSGSFLVENQRVDSSHKRSVMQKAEQRWFPSGKKAQQNLVYRPEGCPEAYCKVEVLQASKLVERLGEVLSISTTTAEHCIIDINDRHWLHAQNLLFAKNHDKEGITGPAGQEYVGMVERVPALVCSGPHPGMKDFQRRPRKGWPSDKLISMLIQLPMLLVLIGHKLSPDFGLQTRISWSALEMLISKEIPEWVIQGYIAFKYTWKSVLRSDPCCKDGRSQVGSYHLKNLLFYQLENNPPSKVRSPFQVFLELAGALRQCLISGTLPHYFLPNCDLLETVQDTARQLALGSIQKILANPLVAIICSPVEPGQLYGDVSPAELAECVSAVSSRPQCEQSRGRLKDLLGQLEACRQQRYQQQRERDDDFGVSGRPELISLLDLLGEGTQSCRIMKIK